MIRCAALILTGLRSVVCVRHADADSQRAGRMPRF